MPCGAVRFMTVEARPTAVVAQTTTWTEFPKLWGSLLGQVYEFVRPRPELATGHGDELWQNVMLYKDQRPDVEVGVATPRPRSSGCFAEVLDGSSSVSAPPGGRGRAGLPRPLRPRRWRTAWLSLSARHPQRGCPARTFRGASRRSPWSPSG